MTAALSMLARVGGSHCTLVTDKSPVIPEDPPKDCVDPSIRTGRYVAGFTYTVQEVRT
jgi:hypothetical protein